MADDDVEEMRHLRLRFNVGLRATELQKDVESSDGDCDGFQKPVPATSSERPPEAKGSTEASVDDETDAMAAVMGFSGFSSGGKKARSFDIESMLGDIQKSRQAAKKPDSDSDDDQPGLPPSKSSSKPVPEGGTEAGPSVAFLSSSQNLSNLPDDLVDEDSDYSDTDQADDGASSDYRIPCAYDLTFEHGDKPITALSIDPVGARFATGSIDYEVKLWDFGGMQANLNPFRTCKPCESHAINNVSFSNGGEQILVIPGSAQAKIIDRDGFNVMECPKGFQYINDPKHTHGHISTLNSGWFSPKNKSEFLTCSNDFSVRLWDTTTAKEKHKHCMVPKSPKGLKTAVTTCTYSKDGKFAAAGGHDGSIFIWDLASNLVNPKHTIKHAHASESDISSLCFSYDGTAIASRGLDNTVKLWDYKKPKAPIFEVKDLEAHYSQCDVVFSPNDKIIAAGTSVKKNSGEKSRLVFMERGTGKIVKELPVGDYSVIRIAWHPKLNQIFASTAEGTVKVFFDPNISHNGALLCRTSKKRRAKLSDAVTADYVYTPFALPMFKEDKQRSKHAQFERNRKDPVKSHRPDLPVTGPGTQGRVGQAGGTLSSYLVRKLGYATKRPDEDINPREALLRHAEEAAKNPFYVSPAYAKTQPKPIFQKEDEDSGESAPKKAKH